MLTVLHSIDTSGPGGAETVCLNIVTGLDSTQYKNIVVVPRTGWLSEKFLQAGISPIVVKSKGSWSCLYLWRLVRVIRHFRVDVIHSHLFGSNVYCSLAGILTRKPVISMFHGFVDVDASSFAVWLKFLIINKGSRKIIFVSENLKNEYLSTKGVSPSLSEVVYNGVDIEKFRPGRRDTIKKELRLNKDNIIIGSIGNIRPAKGYDILLRTAVLVKTKYNKVKFVIAGQGSGTLYNELISLRRKLNLEGTVFFLSFREDTINLYHNFDIFLLSSTSEGFSVATIEAMACGVPVIVTRSGGPEEIVSQNINGLLVEPRDEIGLFQAINILISDPQMRERFSTMGKKSVVERFQISTIIKRYEKFYEELTSSNHNN